MVSLRLVTVMVLLKGTPVACYHSTFSLIMLNLHNKSIGISTLHEDDDALETNGFVNCMFEQNTSLLLVIDVHASKILIDALFLLLPCFRMLRVKPT